MTEKCSRLALLMTCADPPPPLIRRLLAAAADSEWQVSIKRLNIHVWPVLIRVGQVLCRI